MKKHELFVIRKEVFDNNKKGRYALEREELHIGTVAESCEANHTLYFGEICFMYSSITYGLYVKYKDPEVAKSNTVDDVINDIVDIVDESGKSLIVNDITDEDEYVVCTMEYCLGTDDGYDTFELAAIVAVFIGSGVDCKWYIDKMKMI